MTIGGQKRRVADLKRGSGKCKDWQADKEDQGLTDDKEKIND